MRRRRNSALLATAIACGACSSDPPGTVDEEAIALDVASCAQTAAPCVVSGPASPAEDLAPGYTRAITLRRGAAVSAPLARPFDGRLLWIAIGARSLGDAELRVDIGDRSVTLRPGYGFTRVEVSMDGVRPPPGARVTLTSTAGSADVLFVVGRWSH